MRGSAIARGSTWQALLSRRRFIRQPEAGQRHSRQADAEFLERRAAGDGSGQAFGEFIELTVHTIPFSCFLSRSDNQSIQSPGHSAGARGSEHDDFGNFSPAAGRAEGAGATRECELILAVKEIGVRRIRRSGAGNRERQTFRSVDGCERAGSIQNHWLIRRRRKAHLQLGILNTSAQK